LVVAKCLKSRKYSADQITESFGDKRFVDDVPGKMEVGHIIMAHGGRLKSKAGRPGARGEGLTWVSDLTTEKQKSEARTLRRSTSSLRSALLEPSILYVVLLLSLLPIPEFGGPSREADGGSVCRGVSWAVC